MRIATQIGSRVVSRYKINIEMYRGGGAYDHIPLKQTFILAMGHYYLTLALKTNICLKKQHKFGL